MSSPINLQCVNVKLLAKDPEDVDLEPLIPVFHNWIQGQVFEELLLDVADYRHVHEGPGVVLIGHQANYSVDNTDNRLGVRYNRKAPLEGSNQDRLKQATRAALTAFHRLEGEAGLNGKLQFNGQEIEVSRQAVSGRRVRAFAWQRSARIVWGLCEGQSVVFGVRSAG